jgi:hypothetical protein
MDKRSLIETGTSHNNHILCVIVPEEEVVNGLYKPAAIKEKRYKKLRVVKQLDEDVLKDDILYVPLHSGTEVETPEGVYTIANKRDILFLDRDAK